MASSIMHICVAKKVNEVLRVNEKELFLGSIAPDLSKELGELKFASHFIDDADENKGPNCDRFFKKYNHLLDTPFEIGYFIHLLTDKYWFEDYVTKYTEEFRQKSLVSADLNYIALKNIIYRDYTNLNNDLINDYEISLDLFGNGFVPPVSDITEIDDTKLQLLIDKIGFIIMEAQKTNHAFVIDSTKVMKFIDECAVKIIEDLKKYNIINRF